MGFMSFDLFSLLFLVIFCTVFVLILVQVVRGIGQWNKNNQSPRLTVSALVVAKRTCVHHHHSSGTNGRMHASTSYYVTFQVDSGDRMELNVSGREYGMLAEGDRGDLSFQGTRYLGFERM